MYPPVGIFQKTLHIVAAPSRSSEKRPDHLSPGALGDETLFFQHQASTQN